PRSAGRPVKASTLATRRRLSGGRFGLGIGRGASARRGLGKPPTTRAVLEETTKVIRDLAEGKSVTYEDATIRLDWAPKGKLPVWIAGYGPKALEVTARIADGAIIQLADPSLVGWCVGLIRDGAKKAGRDPNEIAIMAAAAAYVGPRSVALERTRWFPALVSNHAVDLVRRYGETG